jgi:hypothetical protein
VKGRCQGRALSADGDIVAAKVRDGRNLGAAGDNSGVTDLQCKRTLDIRLMPYGLTVAADRCHLAGVYAGIPQQCQCRVAKAFSGATLQVVKARQLVA